MYTRLTKIVKEDDEASSIVCAGYGTEMCHIHNGTPNCGQCPMMKAIISQLFYFEDILLEQKNETACGDE